MIGYITIGTNNLQRAGEFYDCLLSGLGGKRVYTLDRMIAWSSAPTKPLLVVTLPSDNEPAIPGNGNMVALICADKDQVNRLHAKALELGAKDNGSPADYEGQFYGGYFRDLDGNKICVFVMT